MPSRDVPEGSQEGMGRWRGSKKRGGSGNKVEMSVSVAAAHGGRETNRERG